MGKSKSIFRKPISALSPSPFSSSSSSSSSTSSFSSSTVPSFFNPLSSSWSSSSAPSFPPPPSSSSSFSLSFFSSDPSLSADFDEIKQSEIAAAEKYFKFYDVYGEAVQFLAPILLVDNNITP